MRLQRPKKPETAFTREIRQLTSFLECYKEKSIIINDSPSLNDVNQVFLESDFNFEQRRLSQTELHGEQDPRNSYEIARKLSQTSPPREDLKQAPQTTNVHNMNRDPKSIFNLLRNPNEGSQQGFPVSLEYSETERRPSQKMSNLWRESQTDPRNETNLTNSNFRGLERRKVDLLFEKNSGQIMSRKHDFLEKMQHLNQEAAEREEEVVEVNSGKNVFINSDQLKMKKIDFVDQLVDLQVRNKKQMRQEKDEQFANPPVEIKQAESFYEVDSEQRWVGNSRKKNLMNIAQRKLMQKYYGRDVVGAGNTFKQRDTQDKQQENEYFDYTDRGTREFMKGRKKGNKKRSCGTIFKKTSPTGPK